MEANPSVSALALAGLVLPLLLMLVVNIVVGIIAVSMAKKRGFSTVPAFFAGLFGSFLSLFFIAMFPINRQY